MAQRGALRTIVRGAATRAVPEGTDMPPQPDEQTDYIIVGAGSAGCVLAHRLSERADTAVCLIEAGGENRSPVIDTPMGLPLLLRGRRHNWYLETEAQGELRGRRLYWPRGKVLGGSSSINAMIYMRGHPGDYDDWAAAGNPGWGWSDVLPRFLRHEHAPGGDPVHHGSSGPLHVSDLRSPNPLSLDFLRAAEACGLPRRDDFHDGQDLQGCGLYKVTQWQGRRWSAANAFVDPVRHRGNLQLRTGCRVTRVLFDGRRAVGVELLGPRGRQRLRARAEVLLCAGAVHSPQLLLLSGIGDAAALRALGIDVVLDVPGVGRDLQDHLDVTASMREHLHASVGVGPRMLPRLLAQAWRYAGHRDGLLSSNAAEAGGFARSRPGLARPDLQLHFLPSLLRDHGRRLVWGYGVTLHACALRPASRGTISLRSPDPLAPPRIDPAYLSHPDDLPVLREGLRLARRVLGSPAWGRHAGVEVSPGPGVGDDDDALDAYIRDNAETIYHPVGSCRMGRDALAVVDSRLRVRGVDALRVVDASIMPTLVGGNTNAPSMMIGEMAADFLLGRA